MTRKEVKMNKFKSITDVKEFITKTTAKHSKKFVTDNYKISYSNRLKTCLGRTRTKYLMGKPIAIEFTYNQKYLNSFAVNGDDIINTVLHEIAHAIAGGENHHNGYWKSCAIAIGAKPNRFANVSF